MSFYREGQSFFISLKNRQKIDQKNSSLLKCQEDNPYKNQKDFLSKRLFSVFEKMMFVIFMIFLEWLFYKLLNFVDRSEKRVKKPPGWKKVDKSFEKKQDNDFNKLQIFKRKPFYKIYKEVDNCYKYNCNGN